MAPSHAFRDLAVVAYIAQLMAWREGDEIPPMPNGVTKESLPGLLAQLNDPTVRQSVIPRLSALLKVIEANQRGRVA